MSFIPSDLNPLAWFRAVPKAYSDLGFTKSVIGGPIQRLVDQVDTNKYFEYNQISGSEPVLDIISGKIGINMSIQPSLKAKMLFMGGYKIPNLSSIPTLICTKPQYSFSMWVKGTDASGITATCKNGAFFAETRDILNLGQSYIFGASLTTTGKFRMEVKNGSTIVKNSLSDTVVWDDNWHHIVITDDNGTVKLYIDSILDMADFNYVKPPIGQYDTNRQAFGVRPTTTSPLGNSISCGYIGDNIVLDNKIWTQLDVDNLRNYG